MSAIQFTPAQKAAARQIVLSFPFDTKHREGLLSVIENPGRPNLMTTVDVFADAARACPNAAPALKAISGEMGTPLSPETETYLLNHINAFFPSDAERAEMLESMPYQTEESANALMESLRLHWDNIHQSQQQRRQLLALPHNGAMVKALRLR